jgi:hypothetical protein
LLGSSSSSDDDVFYEMALKEHSRGAEIVSIVDIRVVLLAGLHACGLRRGFSVFSLKIEPILSRRWQREDLGMEHELPLAQQVATPNVSESLSPLSKEVDPANQNRFIPYFGVVFRFRSRRSSSRGSCDLYEEDFFQHDVLGFGHGSGSKADEDHYSRHECVCVCVCVCV